MTKEQLAQYIADKDWRPFKEGESFWIIPNVIPVYSFMILLGMVIAILTIAFFWKREKLSLDHLSILIFITIPTSIIGARLGFIFEQLIAGNVASLKGVWWNIRAGGLSIQWGVIISALCDLLYIYFKRNVLDYRKALSYILPAVLIGQAVGRWGNYTNHEVFGKIDETGASVLWLGDTIAKNMYIIRSTDTEGALRVPLFFYEFLTSLIGYVLIVWVFNLFNWFKPGTTGALYLVWYGIVRASMEFLREEYYVFYFVLAILYIIIGLALVVYFELFNNFKLHKANPRYTKQKEKFGKLVWIKYTRLSELQLAQNVNEGEK
ncbi:prolipoprotein diacylglyceryl transferase [Mycoplasma procyoni]|uniref:prolipoprotein diacylglyceryl transferase n=1 Tax=Mycoplasma procyoni TaxID=568784 RepID=UPI00197C075C|nr:prolipoprotein diacylglyceryl transferase [Mycoplasma procyoni]MBN3535007.1 prolipoprotein diacylglyceryl transferase [Mycoplasma procyoni]